GASNTPPTPAETNPPAPARGATPATSPGVSPTGGAIGTLTPLDRKFLTDAASGAAMEVQLGNLAAQKATSEDVKRFGQRMAADHSQGGQTLRQMASHL